jgi:hypothetical protein
MAPGRRGGGDLGMPTASLDELTRRVTGKPGVRASASLDVAVGKLARQADQQQAESGLLRMLVPVPITAPQLNAQNGLAGGAGTIISPDTLGPHDGFAWDVRRLTAASFTAGTVTAYLNYQADENALYVWTSAGTYTIGGGVILGDTDALIFVAAGITGVVTVSGQAYNVPTPLLPRYLL